ncbi:riboflavin synthase [Ferroacidibacillus organovorans]|uniref:Riboflavin synthase n=1 Tax=Ferroacidibacillus organovorans TaxID=1765683 RepID=A0A117SXS8_9BACL|nr:riboflavin synthase [Ferroacidibacillus organovorans]KUO95871.1 riboflavin synthase subunit alpha [Ferroacidibacillus organovorans]
MFTGLIEEVGRIHQIERKGRSLLLTIAAKRVLEDAKTGDSIAVNGVCLTVTNRWNDRFTVDVVPETVARSTLQRLQPGSRVNLERALRADGRFGGHIVAGHVDAVGQIRQILPDENARVITIQAQSEIMRYIVEKGSIAVDGISLTVMDVSDVSFRVSVIPHTAGESTAEDFAIGQPVNLEVDVLGKYVERLLSTKNGDMHTGLTFAKLQQYGY